MAIVRWDPFRELTGVHERMNRIFGGVYARTSDGVLMNQGAWVPAVDVYDNGNHELVLKVELPDMKREEIDIIVDNDTLTIKGEKKVDGDVKPEQFQRMERIYGTFSRAFTLSPTVDTTKVSAEYKNGVLTIRLPQREDAKPKQIKVDVAA